MEKTSVVQKAEKLAHYALREPKRFRQIDGFIHAGLGNVVPYDQDGDVLMMGDTIELMNGAPVRVLIDPSTTHEDAVRVLSKIAEWAKSEGHWGALSELLTDKPASEAGDSIPF